MHWRSPAFLLSCLSLAMAGALSGCSGGGGTKPSTASAGGSPQSSASATSTIGIRSLDLSKSPDVQALIASTGGEFVQDGVIYTDLTGDGIDEAVVPISSGGTLGDVAFAVLSPSGANGTKTLLKVAPSDGAGGLLVEVVGGQLEMTRPVYGPDDPNCCPTSLRKTTYSWDGATLVAGTPTTSDNRGGGGKLTPPATAPQ